jgi:ssDNA-binding Zn-finger/Zn-ribbon topoisomerase 1
MENEFNNCPICGRPMLKIETNIYDKEEIYPNCTVQVLTNTVTGEVSVGWWKNGGKEDG